MVTNIGNTGHQSSHLRSHELPRPPSTYGLRRRHSYGTTLTSGPGKAVVTAAAVSKVNTSSARQVTNGNESSTGTAIDDRSKSRGKRTVTILTDEKSHPRPIKGDVDDSYNGSDVDFANEILSLSGSDSWSLSSSSPSYCFSDCPSFYSPRLESAAAPQDDFVRKGASNYRHQSSSPFTSHPHPSHHRKAVNSISPHFYQRHTTGPCCNSRQSGVNITTSNQGKIQGKSTINRKIASAIITLKYEPSYHLPVGKKRFALSGNNNNSMKLVKIYQQISRGSASFLVCARYISPESTFKFTVYRRENILNSFSLSIFFDSIRETRISSCCEFKHQPGTKISLNLTIVNIKSLLDPSDVICETCIKGILWSEWLGKSLTDKKGKNFRVEKFTPEESGELSNNNENEKDENFESQLSSPVISETDYKEELLSYSTNNGLEKASKVKDEDEEEKVEEKNKKMPHSTVEKNYEKNSESKRRKESLKGKNETPSEKSTVRTTIMTTKDAQDASNIILQKKRQVQMETMLNSSKEKVEEKVKGEIGKEKNIHEETFNQGVNDESGKHHLTSSLGVKVNEDPEPSTTYGQSSFEDEDEETETDGEKLEVDADGEETEDEPATLVL